MTQRDMTLDLITDFARYMVNLHNDHSQAWSNLPTSEQKRIVEDIRVSIFKHHGSYGEPYLEIRNGAQKVTNLRFYDLEKARQTAIASVSDEFTIVDVVEVFERSVASFYQKVEKTVVESGAD